MTSTPQASGEARVVGSTRPLDRIVGSELLKIAAVVALFVWYPLATLKNPVVDPDIWWHMRTGEWIVQYHAFPRTDPFSVGGANKAWVAYSWSFEVLAYWVGKTWGLLGIAALKTMTWVATTCAFYALMRRVVRQFGRAAALTALGSYAMTRVFGPRPGAYSVLFFVVELMILWDADRNGRPGKLWLLPLLLCVWANVHAQFVYGLFVLGLFCVDPILQRLFRRNAAPEGPIPTRTWWTILAVSTAATLVNPYGWGVYRVVFEYGHQVWSTRYIAEMSALPFDQFSDYLVALLALGAAFALGRERQVRPLWAVLLAWAAISAFRSQRDIWVLTIVACTLIGAGMNSGVKEPVRLDRRSRLAALAAILLILLVGWQRFAPTNRELLSYAALRLPIGAVAYIHEHHLQGPIFNDFDWGGFLIYALPEEPVVVDGRTNVHGLDELKQSFSTWRGGPGWAADPALARANLVIAGPAFPLTQLLRMDAHFQAVFDDGVSVVFQRVAPANARAQR